MSWKYLFSDVFKCTCLTLEKWYESSSITDQMSGDEFVRVLTSLLDILGERVMGHLRNNTIKTHHSQLGDTSWAFGPKRPNQNSPTLAETVPV
ncbi:hypothetical protein CDAR_595821 [Caerostris darwini]|uniref:Uncharacterized protein n=1 Tax=Caerostris darwini TaxID=1538125 RepID=A0AAV4Q8B2_9ARAC|nr:hypothetical protein CDAR_595821 [Caerostris darwini]